MPETPLAPTAPTALPPDARNRLVGVLVLGLGAMLLLVSLFLDWFEPGLSAWTVFEVWDLVLAGLTLMALVAVVSRLEFGARRPDSWLLVPALVAPVVVVAALLNHPPAAQGLDQDPMIGMWLALAGSLLMALGALAAIARISVALDPGGSRVASPPSPASPEAPPPASPVPPPTEPPGDPNDPARGDAPPTRPTRRIFR